MVFTTLHTNSAAGSFTRLGEMGVEPFLISASTVGVMAQRLARRLCQQCKEPFPIDEQAAKYLGLTPGETVFKGKGCDACGQKGVKGRVGIYEVMVMNGRLRKLIAASALTEDIHQAAIEEGKIGRAHV